MNIQEIAQLCGVSTATISRVLNDSPSVKQSTRDHILAVMAEQGYTPNAFARGLGLNTMRMVGILCTDIDDAYYAKAVALVESGLREQGFDSLLCCTGGRLEDKKKYLAMLLEKRVDAVVLVGSAFREEKDNSHIRRAVEQVPVVIVNGAIDIPGAYSVLCDERQAMLENVRLLATRGCRNILYIYDVLTYSGAQKLAGYREGLASCGLGEDPGLQLKTGKDIDGVRAAVGDALNRMPEIDAVLAAEDLLAVGAQKALAAAGSRQPLIGFNNSRYARCATPELTSVDNMLEILCPTATSLLADVLAGKDRPSKIMITGRLVERDTFRRAEEG